MRKMIIAAAVFLCAAGIASAEEQPLFTLADSSLVLAETFMACAEQEGACSEKDILALKSQAESYIGELVRVVAAGKASALHLTVEQASALNEKAKALRAQLIHVESFDYICSASATWLQGSLWFFTSAFQVLESLWSWSPGLAVLACTYFIILGILFGLCGLVIWPACLLWWL